MKTEIDSLKLYFSAAFIFLGILIGTLTALSATSQVQFVLATIFTLFGGSFITLLNKLSVDKLKIVTIAILCLSAGTLTGVYTGILVQEYRLLSPKVARDKINDFRNKTTEEKYLRNIPLNEIAEINQKYRNNHINATVAYEQIYKFLQNLNLPNHP